MGPGRNKLEEGGGEGERLLPVGECGLLVEMSEGGKGWLEGLKVGETSMGRETDLELVISFYIPCLDVQKLYINAGYQARNLYGLCVFQ